MLSRRCFTAFIVLLFTQIPNLVSAAEEASVAAAYTIIDNDTGHVLESVNGLKKRQVASLTKIATVMVVLDWCKAANHDVSEMAVVPDEVARMAGSNPVGMVPGDFVSLRDLIYSAMLPSDNVAAYTLASHVGRSLRAANSGKSDLGPVDTFVAQMNALARSLKMDRTLFLNPTGFEPGSGSLPYSTSEDMALLTRYAMKDKGFRFYVSQKERKISIVRAMQPNEFLIKNTNELLGENNIDGVKTGLTSAAGPCLILSAAKAPETREENGKIFVTTRRVTVVILGARDRFAAGRQLMERAWNLEQQWAAGGRKLQRKIK